MFREYCLIGFVAWVSLVAVSTADAPLKALIVDGQNVHHNWKETTPLLKKQLEETGLFSVDVATATKGNNLAGFNPKFADYNVVVSNYGYQSEMWPEKIRGEFEKYVADGGGLVVYHSASNAFPEWKEYNEMAGVGGWCGRCEKDGPYLRWRDGKIVRDMTPGSAGAHAPAHEFQLTVRLLDHPITKSLPKVFMHSTDELYNRLRGPAKNLTVLATAFSPKSKAGPSDHESGSDEHEPMLMTIEYGKGRVFHTAFGHGPEQLRSVAFIATFQRGTEWAAAGKVTQKVPADFPGPDKANMRK